MTSEGFNRVTDGMSSLQASFEWGISEVVWQIEQNRNVLINILEVLMAPLNTQAKERRKRAEEAYANGWIDDAEEEFLASEKLNKYDFSIHISLGTIYLFNKLNKNKALEYYEKAIKYAKPKSPYYASYALLHKGLILFDFGKIEDAEKCTIEAIKLSPNFAEANYQNAQYNSLLGNINKSLSSLEKAISFDINYVLKADNDSLFNPIKIQFHQFIQNKVESETASLSNSLKKLSQNFDLFYDNHISFKKIYNDFRRYIEEILTSVKGEKVYYGDIQMSMSGGQIHFANYYETTNNERYHMGTLEGMKFATIKNGIENAKDLINRNSLGTWTN